MATNTKSQNSQSNNSQNEKLDDSHLLSDQTIKEFYDSVTEMTQRVKDTSSEIAHGSVDFVKKYPIHTAIGAALVGYIIGATTTKTSNRKD